MISTFTMRLNEIIVPFNFTNNSYKLLLFTILICSILNLTGDIKAESFENSRNDVDTSMAKTVVRFMAILFHLKKNTHSKSIIIGHCLRNIPILASTRQVLRISNRGTYCNNK